VKKLLCVCALVVLVNACGSSSTSPTPTTPVTVTKIISVSGDLAFGNVNIGESPTRTFTIGNSGNTALTYTGFTASGGTGATGFTASPLTATIQPGASQSVSVRFTPTIAQFYSNVLSVTGDQTGGGAAINVSGVGINNAPLFTRSGSGNTVFDMPSSVTKLHIVGNYTGSSSNFIIWVGPAGSSCSISGGSGCRLLVNVILGTFAGNSPTYDGIVQTGGGGTVSISLSAGVSWSLTEVR
jgi:hypothetical protein